MRALVTNQSRIPQKKCEQYWPDEGCEEYGPISVQLLDTEELPDFTIRTFLLSKVSLIYEAQKRDSFSHSVTLWYDRGVFFFLYLGGSLGCVERLCRSWLSSRKSDPNFPLRTISQLG